MSTFITFIIVLSLLVFVHELGHFSAAKFFGVYVKEFAIGFPPRLFKFKKGETTYSFNLIPLGGFVSIKGEAGDFKDEEDSFSYKPIWQRAIILAAGVIMNFITAVLLISIGFMIGLPVSVEDSSQLGAGANVREEGIQIFQVLENSPAALAEIQMGDIIHQVNGKSFSEITGVQEYIGGLAGEPVNIEIKRGKTFLNKEVTPELLEEVNTVGMGVALVKSGIVSYPPHYALWQGTKRTIGITGQIIEGFRDLIGKLFSSEKIGAAVAGPVGIAVLTGQASQLGFSYLLQFTALLSINLAILNLLPFPALDGARLFLLGVEKVRGKAMDENMEGLIHSLGFLLLMLLMIVVTYKDVIKYGGNILEAVTSIFS